MIKNIRARIFVAVPILCSVSGHTDYKALLILSLSIMDCHVPHWMHSQQLLCRTVTAMFMHSLRKDISCTALAFLLPTFGKRTQEEAGAPRKRRVTVWTPTTTKATMENVQNDPPMQASSSATGSHDATEHVVAEADAEIQNLQNDPSGPEQDVSTERVAAAVEATISMQAIVTEWATLSTDEAREVVHAAQIILKGNQNDLRKLCKPWGVQLKVQKRYRPLASIKQDLQMAVTKHVLKLKSKTTVAAGSNATEHTETEDHAEALVVAAAVGNFGCSRKHLNRPFPKDRNLGYRTPEIPFWQISWIFMKSKPPDAWIS